MTTPDREKQVQQAFESALNSHGYNFQYAVLRKAYELYTSKKSKWLFEVVEFPVESQDKGTRIDFVLRLHDDFVQGEHTPHFLLAECKRANPSLSNWCFAKAPYVARNRMGIEPYFIEEFYQDVNHQIGWTSTKIISNANNAFQIALEIKNVEGKGDSTGQGRGAIEEATAQVLRGMSGMMEFLSKNTQIIEPKRLARLVPVIFTTAELWSTDANISEAEIETGKMDITKSDFQKRDWLIYQYHQSPGLKHNLRLRETPNTFGDILNQEYIRSVFIVNTSGIEGFLGWSSRLHWEQ